MIDSDFEDYYDAALREAVLSRPPASVTGGAGDGGVRDGRAGNGRYWNRQRRAEPSRAVRFAVLRALGWPLVPHGIVADLCAKLSREHRVVIYRDAFAHGDTSAPDGGDPLVFASRDEALIHYPEAFCSYYALNADQADRVVSLTHLVIGNRRFELAYRQVNPIGTSPEAWASNRGAFEVMVVREYPARHYDAHVARPLWSVDYVMALHGKMVIPMPTAFDFNIAPMLANTGISRLLSAEETARLILDAYDYYASMGSANAAGVPAIANPETENPEAASRYREDEEAGPFLEEPEVVPVDGIPSGGTPGAGMPVDAALPEDAGPNWERTAGEHSEGVQPESMQPEGVRHEGGLPDLPGDQ